MPACVCMENHSCISTGMHGPTCNFWANLTFLAMARREVDSLDILDRDVNHVFHVNQDGARPLALHLEASQVRKTPSWPRS
jgi:hypothetical protein